MARVTVEDCVVRVPNRFELVIMSGQRAREISAGAPLTVERDNDKNPVVALREIADDTVSLDGLRESLVKGHQRHVEMDEEPEDEIVELMAAEEGWLGQAGRAEGTAAAPVGTAAVADEGADDDADQPDADGDVDDVTDTGVAEGGSEPDEDALMSAVADDDAEPVVDPDDVV